MKKTCDHCQQPVGESLHQVHIAPEHEGPRGIFHIDCWWPAWLKLHPKVERLLDPVREARVPVGAK